MLSLFQAINFHWSNCSACVLDIMTEFGIDCWLQGCFCAAQVLVGCDGARSVVATSMGITEPQSVGQLAIRGLAEFKSGHNFEPIADQIIGQGLRAGIVPVSKTKAYWFVMFKDSPSGTDTHSFYFLFLNSYTCSRIEGPSWRIFQIV